MSRVSVIIPVYNSAKTVGEALDSVAAQTYTDYEIIVVNDGSSDQSENVIKKYMRPPLDVTYVEQVNKGPGAARNTGLRLAKGEFVAFLDADDLWDKDKLATAVQAMDAHPEVKLVFTDMRHVVNNSLAHSSYLHERGYRHIASGHIYDNLLKGNFIFTPTVVLRRDALDETGQFDEQLPIAEDYDLWLRITRQYPVYYLDRPLVTRRRMGSNITENKQAYVQSCIRLREKLLEVHKTEPDRRRLIARQLKRDHYNLGYILFADLKFKESRKFFFKTLPARNYFLKSLFYIVVSFLPVSVIRSLRRAKGRGETS